MSRIEKIEWDPKYSVDVKEIDTYQKKIFEQLNKLIDIKKREKEKEEKKEEELELKVYINVIAEISEHSRSYFRFEEKYLKERGYPDFKDHSKAHRQFIKKFLILRRDITDDRSNLTYDAIMELKEWLTNHILTFDSPYVPFLRIDKYIKESKKKN